VSTAIGEFAGDAVETGVLRVTLEHPPAWRRWGKPRLPGRASVPESGHGQFSTGGVSRYARKADGDASWASLLEIGHVRVRRILCGRQPDFTHLPLFDLDCILCVRKTRGYSEDCWYHRWHTTDPHRRVPFPKDHTTTHRLLAPWVPERAAHYTASLIRFPYW